MKPDEANLPRVRLDEADVKAARRVLESIDDGTAEYWDADDLRRHRDEELRGPVADTG